MRSRREEIMRGIPLAIAVFSAAFPAICHASSFFEGNDLHELCETKRALAQAYVMGVTDGMDSYGVTSDGNSPFCVPPNVRSKQISDIACNYLRDNPEKRQYSAASNIFAAVLAAFPCR